MKSATIKELYQTCPKCGGDLLIRVQKETEFDYKCYECGYTETRKRDEPVVKEKVVEVEESSDDKKKGKKKK